MPHGANKQFTDQTFAYGGGVMKPSKVKGEKAGPHGSFPIGDKKHARLAISGATRSFRAGHISASTEANIKAKARAKLGQ
jgi:hypothetical protein